MAIGKKTGGRDFKPGQVANPIGARAHNPETKALKKLTRESLKDMLELLMVCNTDELEALSREPAVPIIKSLAAASLVRARRTGDWSRVEGIFARAIGTVKVEIEATGKDGTPLIPHTPELRAQELESILKTLEQLKNAAGGN